MEYLIVIAIIVGAIVIVTLAYRFTGFRPHRPPKPSFVLLPKYEAVFDAPPDAIREALEAAKFTSSEGNKNVFNRGSAVGDFSVKYAKMRAEIDPDRRMLRVYAPYMGALFDTGDIWQLTEDILAPAREDAG